MDDESARIGATVSLVGRGCDRDVAAMAALALYPLVDHIPASQRFTREVLKRSRKFARELRRARPADIHRLATAPLVFYYGLAMGLSEIYYIQRFARVLGVQSASQTDDERHQPRVAGAGAFAMVSLEPVLASCLRGSYSSIAAGAEFWSAEWGQLSAEATHRMARVLMMAEMTLLTRAWRIAPTWADTFCCSNDEAWNEMISFWVSWMGLDALEISCASSIWDSWDGIAESSFGMARQVNRAINERLGRGETKNPVVIVMLGRMFTSGSVAALNHLIAIRGLLREKGVPVGPDAAEASLATGSASPQSR